VAYVGKGLWPSGLAVFYPHPEGSMAVWKVVLAAALLLAITVLAWLYRSSRGFLFTGWFWYLVAMVPMIGVVQVGRQAMADRYAYLPFIGIFLVGVWGCAELFAFLHLPPVANRAAALAAVAVYASMAFLQVHYWHDSYTLFSHAVSVTVRNGIAEDNLGTALMEMGRPDLALPHFVAAAEFAPYLSTPHYNLGVLQQQQSHPELAKVEYERALKYSTDSTEIAQAHSNLGFLLVDRNDLTGAKEQFTAALQINPEKQNSLLGRGIVEFHQEDLDSAIRDLSHAAQITPLAQANFWLGRAFEAKGQMQAAAMAYQAALGLAPDMTNAKERLNALQAANHESMHR
jgi:protein O-mannosyl-transferase